MVPLIVSPKLIGVSAPCTKGTKIRIDRITATISKTRCCFMINT
jgi:hypothetical protein